MILCIFLAWGFGSNLGFVDGLCCRDERLSYFAIQIQSWFFKTQSKRFFKCEVQVQM